MPEDTFSHDTAHMSTRRSNVTFRTKIGVSVLLSLFIYCKIDLQSNLHVWWSGGAKVLCILHHWGVQLILTYSWARPAILVVGKGRGGMFLFLLFLHFHSCSSFFPVPLFHLLYSLSSISFLPFSGRRHKITLKGWRVVKPQHNQSNLYTIYEGKSISNQPIPFSIDRDTQDFHALFQYMF